MVKCKSGDDYVGRLNEHKHVISSAVEDVTEPAYFLNLNASCCRMSIHVFKPFSNISRSSVFFLSRHAYSIVWDTKFTVFHSFILYGYGFLSRGFADRSEILHDSSATSQTGFLLF